MKIAIAKQDNHTVGGFEGVVASIARGLRQRGHTVEIAAIDTAGRPTTHLGVPVNDDQVGTFPEFFLHFNNIARFEALDLSAYDVVLCTQPGSYAVRHPRKVILFYHHVRSFYDLRDAYEMSRGENRELHRLASALVRDADALYLTPDIPILAGSARVKQRLLRENGLRDNVEVFSAGVDESFFASEQPASFEAPLCVSRCEFPKRAELFVHAMHHVTGVEGRLVGVGNFFYRVRGIDAWLRLRHADAAARTDGVEDGVKDECDVDDDQLWLYDTIHRSEDELRAARETVAARGLPGAVQFLGKISQADLLHEYRSASCVVCPAFDEDYGLTCLEAMACGKPVIACRDGGGYTELIDDGVDGFVVDPTGPAIARAIERLKDRERARTMGARGRQKAHAYTWTRAIDQVESALRKVLP